MNDDSGSDVNDVLDVNDVPGIVLDVDLGQLAVWTQGNLGPFGRRINDVLGVDFGRY